MALGWLIWLAVNPSTQHTKSVYGHTYALFTLFQLWCNRDTYSPHPLAHHSNCLLAAGANRSTSPPPLTTQSPPAAHCLLRHPRARSAQCCWLECGTKGNPWTGFSSAWHQSLVLVNPSNAQKIDSQTEKWSNSIDEHNSTYHPIMMLPSLTLDDYILLFLTCTPSGDCFIRNIFTQYDQSNIKESDAGAQILLKFHMQPL